MRLLILGTGGMANQHAKHFAAIPGVTLVGGVDVDPKRVEAFNATHNISRGFGSGWSMWAHGRRSSRTDTRSFTRWRRLAT